MSHIKITDVVVPPHQASYTSHINAFRTVPFGQTPSASLFTSQGQKLSVKIPEKSLINPRNCTAEFDILVSSNTAVLCDVFNMFEFVEYKSSASESNQRRMYSDEMRMRALSLPYEILNACAPSWNLETANYKPPTIAAAQTVKLSLPLDYLWYEWFSGEHTNIQLNDNSEHYIEFHCRNGIVVTGSGVPSMTDFKLVFTDFNGQRNHNGLFHSKHLQPVINQRARAAHRVLMLDCEPKSESRTFTASTRSEIKLDVFNGAIAALLFVARNGNAVASRARYLTSDFGPNASFDVTTSAGSEILSYGNPISGKMLQDVVMRNAGLSNIAELKRSNYYLLPFAPVVPNEHSGVHGYLWAESNNDLVLRITPDVAATQPVVTITMTNPANDDGTYNFAWAGEVSPTSLVFNSNVSAMKSSFESMNVCQLHGVTVTMSGTAAATFTITFANMQEDLIERYGLPQVIGNNLNDGGVEELPVSSLTTRFVDGSTRLGAVQFDVYALKWRNVDHRGGKYIVSDWRPHA